MIENPTGDEGRDPVPGSSWTARAEQAKRDGTFYAEGEQVEVPPISAAERWRRFLLGSGIALVLAVIARMILTAATGRGNPFEPGFLVDALIGGAFFAALVGLYAAFRFRRRPPDATGGR